VPLQNPKLKGTVGGRGSHVESISQRFGWRRVHASFALCCAEGEGIDFGGGGAYARAHCEEVTPVASGAATSAEAAIQLVAAFILLRMARSQTVRRLR
jgi:hypothetical protein